MAMHSENAAQWLAATRSGSKEALGQLLEACRCYLLLVAQKELDPDLRAKGGASDLVQQTFLEAQRDFAAGLMQRTANAVRKLCLRAIDRMQQEMDGSP